MMILLCYFYSIYNFLFLHIFLPCLYGMLKSNTAYMYRHSGHWYLSRPWISSIGIPNSNPDMMNKMVLKSLLLHIISKFFVLSVCQVQKLMIRLHHIILAFLISYFIPLPILSDGHSPYHIEIHCNQEVENAYRNLRWQIPRRILRLEIMRWYNVPDSICNCLGACHSEFLSWACDIVARKAQDSCPSYGYTMTKGIPY